MLSYKINTLDTCLSVKGREGLLEVPSSSPNGDKNLPIKKRIMSYKFNKIIIII